ncbi:MAG TPA: metal-dependent hydrolase [Acidimicrobiales bacterium]|nr:metal-dependent hydrolase [Acidimicrobiales bacterium]
MTETRAPNRTITTRRISFEESLAGLPRHFAGDGDLVSSHVIAGLSSVFPDGEDFFVRSVRHFRDRVTDPVLKRQVAGFIGQESVHGREHRVLNDKLAELGYPTKQIERLTKAGLALRWRVLPPKSNLAVTAALEHFTATMAELVMTDEEIRHALGHEAVRNLFLWHALEESEHKAVAFDVYRAVGGTERMRIWTMKVVRIGFMLGSLVGMVVSLALDGKTYKPGVLRKSLARMRGTSLVSRKLWDQLREYDRPGFHPDDHDTTALVEYWRAELFGEQGVLKGQLAGSAA